MGSRPLVGLLSLSTTRQGSVWKIDALIRLPRFISGSRLLSSGSKRSATLERSTSRSSKLIRSSHLALALLPG